MVLLKPTPCPYTSVVRGKKLRDKGVENRCNRTIVLEDTESYRMDSRSEVRLV